MKLKYYASVRGWLFLFAFSLAVLISSCQDKKADGRNQTNPAPQSFPVISLETMDIKHYNKYPATIEGVENIGIQAKVDGYIQSIYVDEGQFVTKGQPLFQLETMAMTQSAKAAESSIMVAEAGVNVAQVEVDRLKPLVNKGIISDVQLKTAEANLASAQSRVEEAKSQFQGIRENIGYSRINSPVSGVVGRIPFRQGTLVGRSEGKPLTYVSNIKDVYIYFALNEKEFLDFAAGLKGESVKEKIDSLPPVEFILANGKTYEHKGRIQTVTGQIDPKTGTINFRAIFPNPQYILRDGGSGMIAIPTVYDDALVVPLQSTYEMQGRKYVYLVNDGDSLRSQPVDFYEVVDNKVLVSNGVKAGDVILAAGVGNVRNGMVIEPKREDFNNYVDNITPVFK